MSDIPSTCRIEVDASPSSRKPLPAAGDYIANGFHVEPAMDRFDRCGARCVAGRTPDGSARHKDALKVGSCSALSPVG